MRIDKSTGLYGVYNKNMSQVNNDRNEKGKKDEINISDKAKSYQFALGIVRQEPEIRQEKVTELKEKIQSGNYNVSSEDIAEKMMNDANLHKLLR